MVDFITSEDNNGMQPIHEAALYGNNHAIGKLVSAVTALGFASVNNDNKMMELFEPSLAQ